MRKFSDWPTYPQLYVKSKLVGGADILNEMHKEGSLKELLGNLGIKNYLDIGKVESKVEVKENP